MTLGKGIPHQLSKTNHGITPLNSSDIPTLDRAVSDYEQSGGTLTHDCKFGYDPLWSTPHLIARRERIFQDTAPSFEDIFAAAISNNYHVLETSIDIFKDTTFRLLDFI